MAAFFFVAAFLSFAMEVRVTGERALGRSRAYWVFAALYRAGVTAELLPIVEAIPELAAQVARPFDAEEAAAAHQGLFGFQVFPYQSVFLGEDGLLGGTESERVRGAHRTAGYAPGAAADDPDHLAHELALLSFLCGAEADAHADGRAEKAAVARRQQAAFLRDHLLWWLPLFVPAVARQGDGVYAALAGLTWALVIDHWQDVGAGRSASEDAHWAGTNWAGPAGRSASEDAHSAAMDPVGGGAALGAGASEDAHWAVTNLGGSGAARGAGASEDAHWAAMNSAGGDDGAMGAGAGRWLAAHLLLPVRSGLFVSRADLARCARQAGLPHGFGDRRQMAATLLDAATRYNQVPPVVDALGALVAGQAGFWDAPANAVLPAPARSFWRARLAATTDLLASLESTR